MAKSSSAARDDPCRVGKKIVQIARDKSRETGGGHYKPQTLGSGSPTPELKLAQESANSRLIACSENRL